VPVGRRGKHNGLIGYSRSREHTNRKGETWAKMKKKNVFVKRGSAWGGSGLSRVEDHHWLGRFSWAEERLFLRRRELWGVLRKKTSKTNSSATKSDGSKQHFKTVGGEEVGKKGI